MKYALILYGGLRSYKLSSKYLFNNLLNINDVDIFISTHNDSILCSNMDKKIDFENIYGNHLKCISFIEDNDNSFLINKLKEKIKKVDIDLYNHYANEIENMKNLNDWNTFYKKIYNKNKNGWYLKNNSDFTYLLHEIIMIYHRLNAFNQLEKYKIENNITYDGVIIYRPDLFFKVPLYLHKFIFDDDIIYLRLEFMFISSYNGIKKLTEKLFEEYYDLDYDDKNIENYNYKYISERQHIIFLHKNYKYVYGILNSLYHYRTIDEKTNIPLNFQNDISDIQEKTDNFYDNLKIITNNYNNFN